jgi:hypothetical protein
VRVDIEMKGGCILDSELVDQANRLACTAIVLRQISEDGYYVNKRVGGIRRGVSQP